MSGDRKRDQVSRTTIKHFEKDTAGHIARKVNKLINTTTLPLEQGQRESLPSFHGRFDAAVKERNKLLHANPITAAGGQQLLNKGPHQWPPDDVEAAADRFAEVAIEGNDLFHKVLRPLAA